MTLELTTTEAAAVETLKAQAARKPERVAVLVAEVRRRLDADMEIPMNGTPIRREFAEYLLGLFAPETNQPVPEPAPTPVATTATVDDASIITVRVVDFKRGLRYVKQFGGTFDGDTKLWTIRNPSENARNSLRAAGAYGLAVVGMVRN